MVLVSLQSLCVTFLSTGHSNSCEFFSWNLSKQGGNHFYGPGTFYSNIFSHDTPLYLFHKD